MSRSFSNDGYIVKLFPFPFYAERIWELIGFEFMVLYGWEINT